MKIIIVEDEIAASENLAYLLHEIDSKIEIVTVLDSVKLAVDYFSKSIDADLVLMDIHLADGISFEIFDQVKINIPVIFTTAYDQYAIKAFKVNSIDYLLKPIVEEELSAALDKFKNLTTVTEVETNQQMKGLLEMLQVKNKLYKSTYLVSQRDEILPLSINTIAFLYIDTGIVKAVTDDNKSYAIDKKLEDIEEELDPSLFFRANRQFIVNKKAIESIKLYFNGKLIINTNPVFSERIVVSKAKAPIFKKWMDS